ncbi:MAG: adenylate/guanylate cyclase domain-containing protein [Cyclobacteriaceae bacterium]
MTFNARFRIKLEKVTIITVAFMLIGTLLPLLNKILLNSHHSLGVSPEYDFTLDLLLGILSGFSGGLLGGIVLVFLINDKMRKKPFGIGIMLTAVFFVLIYYFTSFLIAFTQATSKSELPFYHQEVLSKVMDLVTAPMSVVTFMHWGLVVVGTQFMLQVNDKFGQGVLKYFLIGKYHKPGEEERIFMFLDLKSSTTIAEKIGHHDYFNLLKDFYSDITYPIIATKGEIYQYVGDEIVVSWKMNNGLKNANCICCFYEIKKKINQLSDKYHHKYGFVPDFKAGFHLGKVTAGEIGIIKRDIVYTGDVLNTCARIQEQCNHHGVEILISEDLIKLIKTSAIGYPHKIGDIALRGKEEKIALYTLSGV